MNSDQIRFGFCNSSGATCTEEWFQGHFATNLARPTTNTRSRGRKGDMRLGMAMERERERERERCFKPVIIFYKSLDLGYPLSGQDHFSPWNHLNPKPQASSHLLLVSRRNVIQCMKRIWFLSHYTRLHLAIPAQSLQFRSTQAMLIAPSKKEMAVCTAMEWTTLKDRTAFGPCRDTRCGAQKSFGVPGAVWSDDPLDQSCRWFHIWSHWRWIGNLLARNSKKS